MKLPVQHQWLEKEGAPKMLVEGIKLYGILEAEGPANNPVILEWAKELNLDKIYRQDSIPWCGLFMAYECLKAGKPVVKDPLWALNWAHWQKRIPIEMAMLWDVLVFHRPEGGHVGNYAGETKEDFLVYGGNESDKVGFTWITKKRCASVNRPLYNIQPPNIRKIFIDKRTGELSVNES